MVKEDTEFDKPYAGFKFETSEDSHDNLQTMKWKLFANQTEFKKKFEYCD